MSWQFHKITDFGYPLWYQALNIGDHINEYAPQNKQHKQDFILTSSNEHYRLFAEINHAIHAQGEGLSSIQYKVKSPDTNSLIENALLTPSEVIHLQDVAKLIDNLMTFWLYNTLIFVLCMVFIYWKKVQPPPVKQQLTLFVIIVTASVALFSLLGFTTIFYWLHQVVFPDNHQWFFYYQDSLMSTLMKAPDLFAVIGVSIIFNAGIIFWACQKILFKRV